MEHLTPDERKRKIRAQAVDDVPMGIAKAAKRSDTEEIGGQVVGREKRAGNEEEENGRNKVIRVEGEARGDFMSEMAVDELGRDECQLVGI